MVIALVVAAALAAGALFAYFQKRDSDAPGNDSEQFRITTSFYPLYFFAREIAGPDADVVNLTPPGAEPHDVELSGQDIARIYESDILILNGNFEPWADSILQNLAGAPVVVVIAGDGVATNEYIDDSGARSVDPHVWLDPVLAKAQAGNIIAALAKKDPGQAALYRANGNRLIQSLDLLHAEYEAGLKNCAKRAFVTSHAAFGYLAKRYGIEEMSIAGLNPEGDASAEDMSRIVEFAKANGITVIFSEELMSSKLSEAVATEIGAAVMVLNPLEGLAGDALLDGKNYLSEMRSNLSQLRTALQCQ